MQNLQARAWGASSSPEAKGAEKRQSLRKGCSICPVPTKKDAGKASFDGPTGAAQSLFSPCPFFRSIAATDWISSAPFFPCPLRKSCQSRFFLYLCSLPLSMEVCFVLFLGPRCIGRFLLLFSSDFLIGIGNGKHLCFLSSAGKMVFAPVSQSCEQQNKEQYDFRFHAIFLSFQMSCHKAL